MVYHRWGHSAVPLYNRIFALGGFTNISKKGAKAVSLNSVEAFDFSNENWKEVAPMETARAFMGAAPI